MLVAVLLGGGRARAALIGLNQFANTDPAITFETGSTALPSVPGVYFGAADATFSPSAIGKQALGDLNDGNIDVTFSTPVQAVGAYLINFESESVSYGVTELVYDSNNNLLDSQFTHFGPALKQPPPFMGIALPAAAISKVEWQNSYTTYFGVDNLIYGDASVPEPMSLALFAVGGLLVLGRGRRNENGTGHPGSANPLILSYGVVRK
ncbi:MAG TPA: PEP-CTERM sorting domain-containing protein [Tepidisphaeraceae bacterium]